MSIFEYTIYLPVRHFEFLLHNDTNAMWNNLIPRETLFWKQYSGSTNTKWLGTCEFSVQTRGHRVAHTLLPALQGSSPVNMSNSRLLDIKRSFAQYCKRKWELMPVSVVQKEARRYVLRLDSVYCLSIPCLCCITQSWSRAFSQAATTWSTLSSATTYQDIVDEHT